MKTILNSLLIGGLALLAGCAKRDISELQPVKFPAKGEVFLDDFTGDLQYAAFGGSDVRAFQVDRTVGYGGTFASLRFDVPDANSAQGSYAGGVFYSTSGRDLSGFNALTFYIRATQPATIGTIGFGNDLGESNFIVTKTDLPVNSNWKKVVIPMPDPSKLTAERGLLYYAAGPENDRGYTFWIDEVKFEKLTTIGNVTGLIANGETRVVQNAENNQTINAGPLQVRAGLPDGTNEILGISPRYFAFSSSNPAVASISPAGVATVLAAGNTNITATMAGRPATGSMRIESVGLGIRPGTRAPIPPSRNASDVISLYSNAYTNVPVSTWNTRWEFSTADEQFLNVLGDDVIRYRNLNFVGIEFTSPTINASQMTHFHMDIWTPDPTALPNNFKVLLVDFGPNNTFGGGDDTNHEITITAPTLRTNNWVSIDIPMTSFTGLTRRANLAQMVLSGTIPNVFVTNVYFYRSAALPTVPTVAAPTPTFPANQVTSIFSDAYTSVAGTDLTPNWGQATQTSVMQIAGNNTYRMLGLNYQGIQFGSNQNVTNRSFLHLNFYSVNSTQLRIFLISPPASPGGAPVETPFTLTVPTTGGWSTANIPLSSFAPVALNNVFQIKFEGNGDIFVDNILFRQ